MKFNANSGTFEIARSFVLWILNLQANLVFQHWLKLLMLTLSYRVKLSGVMTMAEEALIADGGRI